MLDNTILKEISAKSSSARRQAVAHLHEVFEVSQRRASAMLGADRSMVR